MKAKNQKSLGFTLIEMLIVVALIAIIAAIAIPNYREYVLRGYRTEARNMLVDIAARQERFRYNSPVYASSVTQLGLAAPYLSENQKYELNMTVGTGPTGNSTYTLTAVPRLTQVQDKCGFLRLDELQTKTSENVATNCWGN